MINNQIRFRRYIITKIILKYYYMDGQQQINDNFNTNKYLSSTNDFFESNSLVAKVAFLLLTLFVFIIVLRLGIALLAFFMTPSDKIKLINGMVNAKQLIVIPQDPSSSGSKTINRSVNESEGIEFTWSCWIYIDDLTYNSGKFRCIFYKGNDYKTNPDLENSQGLNFPNNAPGLYLAPNTNKLVIFMNTFNVINEEIPIDDVPLNKWVNIIIRCQNTTLDVYVNGTITKSHELHGVPKQNYGDVYVAMNGGFSGYISDLWYYNTALGPSEILKLQKKGPNTSMENTGTVNMTKSDYLSLRWFFYGSQDMYNP